MKRIKSRTVLLNPWNDRYISENILTIANKHRPIMYAWNSSGGTRLFQAPSHLKAWLCLQMFQLTNKLSYFHTLLTCVVVWRLHSEAWNALWHMHIRYLLIFLLLEALFPGTTLDIPHRTYWFSYLWAEMNWHGYRAYKMLLLFYFLKRIYAKCHDTINLHRPPVCFVSMKGTIKLTTGNIDCSHYWKSVVLQKQPI